MNSKQPSNILTFKYFGVAEADQVRVTVVEIKLYQVTEMCLWAVCNPHFYKPIYSNFICKTVRLNIYIFKNKERREECKQEQSNRGKQTCNGI